MANNVADDNTPYKRLVEQAAGSVPSPVAGGQNLFIDSSDHALKIKNVSGVVAQAGNSPALKVYTSQSFR